MRVGGLQMPEPWEMLAWARARKGGREQWHLLGNHLENDVVVNVCMNVYISVYLCVFVYMYLCVSLCVVCICVFVSVWVCVCVCLCMYVFPCIHVSVYVYVWVFVSVCACVRMCSHTLELSHHPRSPQVANTRPVGRIWPSTLFYPAQHLVST